MSAIWWWCVLLTWSVTGVACCACHSSGTFFHCDTRVCKNTRPVLVATRLGGSQELGTRAYFLAEPYWTWWRCVTRMCRLLCLLLVWHCRFIVTFLPPTWLFALPGHTLAGFLFWQNLVGRGGDLHLVMSVMWRSCAWKYRLSCFKCHLPGTLFSLCFTCSMHTHPFSETCHSSCDWFFFWKRAEVKTIERKKNLSECLVGFSVFFLFFFFEMQNFCWWKEKRSQSTWGDKAHQCSPTLACSHTTFFTFCFCFLSHHAGWQFFFVPFLLVYSTVYATPLITNLLRRAIFTHFRWQKQTKKKAAKIWPYYSGEWKQVNIWTARFVFIIGCVFCVEALALRNKKEVEGRRDRQRDRERRYFQKKRGGKGKFEWFFLH